jgi:hypothetical protein
VRDSLREFLKLAEKKFKGQIFSVKRRGRKGVSVGRLCNSRKFATLHFGDIEDIALFELENTYFRVGSSYMLKQDIGLSMGGFQSPPLAMIVASMAEYRWLNSLGADAKFICGARYMDDGILFFEQNSLGKHFWNIYISLMKSCYPEGLELEITGFGSYSQILESEIIIHNGVKMLHYNKNSDSVRMLKKQKFKKFIPWASNHDRSTLRNGVLGLCHRMHMNTLDSCIIDLLPVLKAYDDEFRLLHYPSNILKKSLFIFLKSKNQISTAWYDLVRLAYGSK